MIYAISVSMRSSDVIFSQSQPNSPSVEHLRVTNHTECECIYKNRPTTTRPRVTYSWPMPTISTTTKAPVCKCPSHFQAEVEDGTCGCACIDSVAECRQRFEGNEGFTMSDQRYVWFNLLWTPAFSTLAYPFLKNYSFSWFFLQSLDFGRLANLFDIT